MVRNNCEKTSTHIGRTTILVDTTAAALIQKTSSDILVRYFKIVKTYNDHYQNPALMIYELVRDFYDGCDISSYEFAQFKQTGQIRWRHSLGVINLDVACLYTRNLPRALAGTRWQYSCIYELAKNVDRFGIFQYLSAFYKHLAYEYLVKLGLYRFVAENIGWNNGNSTGLNFEGRDFHEILGLNWDQLRQMRRINGTISHFKLIQRVGAVGVILTDRQVERLTAMGIDDVRLAGILKYATPEKAIKYIAKLSEALPSDGGKFISRSSAFGITGFWADYLENCALLGYDMKNSFVLFPRDLKVRHDEAMELVKTQRGELLNRAIQALYDALNNSYSFVWKGILARPPVSADEIIAEGHTLHHCVATGSYIENMAKGKCRILLIRRTDQPDAPFFTTEVRDGMVVQCRGQNNCGMTEEVQKFISEWQKKKLNLQRV